MGRIEDEQPETYLGECMWPETIDDSPKPMSLGQLLKQKLQQTCSSQQHEVFLASHECTLSEIDFSHAGKRILLSRPSPKQKQEPQMDISKLISLADPAWEKDLKELGILSDSIAADELRAEIEAQSKERRSQDIKQAASQILDLGRKVAQRKESLVEDLRRIRASEKVLLKKIKSLEEAWDFGSKTLNYLPVVVEAGFAHPMEFRHVSADLLKVVPVPEKPAE